MFAIKKNGEERIQTELLSKNKELGDGLNVLYYKVEDLEQYGRRTSLRFHNGPMKYSDLQNTYQKVIDTVNNKLNMKEFSPLTTLYIYIYIVDTFLM